MKLITAFFFTYLLSTSAFCQNICDVLGAGGESIANSEVTIEFTIGEPVVSHTFSQEYYFSEGFQQPLDIDVIITSLKQDAFSELLPYPNPTSSIIHLNSLPNSFSFQLIDVQGREVLRGSMIDRNSLELDLENVKSGEYVLIINSGVDTNNYKVVKID